MKECIKDAKKVAGVVEQRRVLHEAAITEYEVNRHHFLMEQEDRRAARRLRASRTRSSRPPPDSPRTFDDEPPPEPVISRLDEAKEAFWKVYEGVSERWDRERQTAAAEAKTAKRLREAERKKAERRRRIISSLDESQGSAGDNEAGTEQERGSGDSDAKVNDMSASITPQRRRFNPAAVASTYTENLQITIKRQESIVNSLQQHLERQDQRAEREEGRSQRRDEETSEYRQQKLQMQRQYYSFKMDMMKNMTMGKENLAPNASR